MKRVAVFGGSRPRPGEADYEQALRLGMLLGREGYSVLTGGYIGSMEAVSRGAAESGGRVIGVTCDEIEHWRPVRANAWVQEERRCATLRERLFYLIEENDAALALPGGPGTLAEIMLTWNLLLVGALPPRPLILIGRGWRETFQQFYRSFDNYIPESQRAWLHFVPDVDAAVERLKQQVE
ncbi:MAG: LOG family protein [Anaerolineales bacterium]|nr:LOG family protein [Anaerolineales bacterium]